MQHVFGPVPSRRLGRSLGVDPIPFKTCNWNCVYCQLGRTPSLVAERRDWIAPEAILAEVKEALGRHGEAGMDWITFVGSGEPTLHASLGWMIREVKKLGGLPVAVITNGSLLHRPEVREEIGVADAVLPTLDAGSAELHRRINRPLPEFSFSDHVAGLEAFRRDYPGQLWVETMLIRGVNDGEEALRDLADVLRRIGADAVHLNTPVRPPSEPQVAPPDPEGMMRALAILGEAARPVGPAPAVVDVPAGADPAEVAADLVTRHPLEDGELRALLARWSDGDVEAALERLQAEGRVARVKRYGKSFWVSVGARFRSEGATPPGRGLDPCRD